MIGPPGLFRRTRQYIPAVGSELIAPAVKGVQARWTERGCRCSGRASNGYAGCGGGCRRPSVEPSEASDTKIDAGQPGLWDDRGVTDRPRLVVCGWSGCGFQVGSVQGDGVAEGFEDRDGAAGGVAEVLAGVVVVAAEVVAGNLVDPV
jgi:hypothetical protein